MLILLQSNHISVVFIHPDRKCSSTWNKKDEKKLAPSGEAYVNNVMMKHHWGLRIRCILSLNLLLFF